MQMKTINHGIITYRLRHWCPCLCCVLVTTNGTSNHFNGKDKTGKDFYKTSNICYHAYKTIKGQRLSAYLQKWA